MSRTRRRWWLWGIGAVACGISTRNDHTAASDRVQDLYIPVGFF